MNHQLRYGAAATLDLDVGADVFVAELVRPAEPLADPAAAIRKAVATPLDFPSLRQATTPGDRVAIALDEDVPQAAEVVAGIVSTLLESRVASRDITVVLAAMPHERADRQARRQLMKELQAALATCGAAETALEVHQPQDRNQLAYLAATEEGFPIYLNRRLVDADVVLPISAVHLASSLNYLGVYGGLFPVFSDEATIARFHLPPADDQEEQSKRKAECDEAAWLLGALFAVQVVPGPGDSLLHVLAGDARSVERRGQQLAAEAWLFEAPRRASVVVATIAGGPQQQSWRELGRALFAARQAAEDQGVIVLCTELKSAPGPAMRRLGDETNPDKTRRRIEQECTPDAIPAHVFAEARRYARIFLLSELGSDVVEDLGLGYVAHAGEIQRLCRGHDSYILLQDAHRAVVRAPGDWNMTSAAAGS